MLTKQSVTTKAYPIQLFKMSLASSMPPVDWEYSGYLECDSQRMIHSVTMFLATDTVETLRNPVQKHIEVPATWWDMFKQEVLSKHFKVKVNTKKVFYTENHTEKVTTVFRDLNVSSERKRGRREIEVFSYDVMGRNVY